MPDQDSSATPQFQRAEYVGAPTGDKCKFCKQPIAGDYFRVNRSMTCPNCVEQVRKRFPQDSHAAFTRALAFGVGGAIVGMILYAVVEGVTGFTIGYLALAVGWIVGKAMMMGSGGIGGRRYQIAAIALTYAAVSIAAVPVGIYQYSKARKALRMEQSQTMNDPQSPAAGDSASAAPEEAPATAALPSLGSVVLRMLLLGLASPFLELQSPASGLIGLVILFVGMQFAWRMTRGTSVQILGPFNSSTPPSAQLNAT